VELGFTDSLVRPDQDIQIPDLGDDGQPIERPAPPPDRFKPFPNAAAASANNGKAPPVSSVIVKARGAAGLYPRPADRLRAVRQTQASRSDVRVTRTTISTVLPGPQIGMPPRSPTRR
jgi:hypothetical protein